MWLSFCRHTLLLHIVMDLIVTNSPTSPPVFQFFKVSLGCVTPFVLVNESARYALIFFVSAFSCATFFFCLIFSMHPHPSSRILFFYTHKTQNIQEYTNGKKMTTWRWEKRPLFFFRRWEPNWSTIVIKDKELLFIYVLIHIA